MTDGKVASLFLEKLGAKICVDLVKIEKKQK